MTTTGRRSKNRYQKEAKERTKEAILRAFGAEFARGDLEGVSIANIAKKAGIAPRTIYRYFPNKASLVLALSKWVSEEMGGNEERRMPIGSPEEYVERRKKTFLNFDKHSNLIRAHLSTPIGRETRTSIAKDVLGRLDASISSWDLDLDARSAAKLKVVTYLLFSGEAWQFYKDVGGLTTLESIEASEWALKRILSTLNSDKK